MASLAVTYTSIRRAIGRFLYDDWDTDTWTAAQKGNVDDIIKAGLRRFYWPPTPEGVPAHEWSFLRQLGSIDVKVDDWDHTLPTDFAMVTGPPVVSGQGMLDRVKPEELLAKRQRRELSGTPEEYALRVVTPIIAESGIQWEMLLYPTPDADVTLLYPYSIEPPMISEDNEIPYGGAVYGDTILEACLAAAEATLVDTEGIHTKRFAECLVTSIRIDQGQQQ